MLKKITYDNILYYTYEIKLNSNELLRYNGFDRDKGSYIGTYHKSKMITDIMNSRKRISELDKYIEIPSNDEYLEYYKLRIESGTCDLLEYKNDIKFRWQPS